MAEVLQFMPKPDGNTRRKVWTYEHAGQTYTITEDPKAPPGERFVWLCDFVRTYRFVGNADSLGAASVRARKAIHKMTQRQIAWEDYVHGDRQNGK